MTMSPPVQRLQTMLDDYVEKFDAIGVMVAIDLPRAPRIHVVAGAQARGEAPLSPSHLYQIGSQTKTFVALGILLLCRDGIVQLDDPVTRYLPLPIDDRVTLRHLIMNSSGIAEYLGVVTGSVGEHKAPSELVLPVLERGLLFAPGAQFDYSNTGWVIAAMVLDAKAPGGYADYVHKRIFEPLGMSDSHVESGYAEARLAHGYFRNADGLMGRAADGFSLSWAYGAGDIISSCDDMLDFYRALSQPSNALGITFADMTAQWAEPATKPIHPSSLGAAYAFGLERRCWGGYEVWGHPGRTVGYGASSWFAPENGVIVTTAFMYIEDPAEPPLLAAQRYNPSLLFTQALATAHSLVDLDDAERRITAEFVSAQ